MSEKQKNNTLELHSLGPVITTHFTWKRATCAWILKVRGMFFISTDETQVIKQCLNNENSFHNRTS